MTSESESGRLAGTLGGPPDRPIALRSSRGSLLRRLLYVVDGVAIAAAWSVALLVQPFVARDRSVATSLVLVVALVIGGFFLNRTLRLYQARVSSIRTEEISRLARASVLLGIAGGISARAADIPITAAEAVIGASLTMLALLTARSGYRGWVSSQRSKGRFTRPVLIVGADEEAAEIRRLMLDHPELGHDIVGVVGDVESAVRAGLVDLHLGPVSRLGDALEATGATGVIISTTALAPEELNAVIRRLIAAGIHIHLTTGLRRVDHRRLRVQPLAHEPFFYVEPPAAALNRGQAALKRALDLVVGGVASLVSLPLFAVLAVLIKLEDRGPAVFKQTRVGRDGRHFTIYKLRTMVTDAEDRKADLFEANQRTGPLFKLDRDPRVTRVGRFLRATSLDELPQLLNVLGGSMSLVGPRPALPEEVEDFDEDLQARTQVKPGVTGLWQVEARDNPSFEAYRRLDLMYVENWSITFDLVILLSTVESVLARAVRGVIALATGRDGACEMVVPAHTVANVVPLAEAPEPEGAERSLSSTASA